MKADERGLALYIGEVVRLTDKSPTYDQMQAHLGVASKATVHRKVTRLVRAGYLTRVAGTKQSLRVARVPPQAEEMRRLVDAAPALLAACQKQNAILKAMEMSCLMPTRHDLGCVISEAVLAIGKATGTWGQE